MHLLTSIEIECLPVNLLYFLSREVGRSEMYKLNELGIVSMTKFLKVDLMLQTHMKFHLVLMVCYVCCYVLCLFELLNIYLYRFFIIYITFNLDQMSLI